MAAQDPDEKSVITLPNPDMAAPAEEIASLAGFARDGEHVPSGKGNDAPNSLHDLLAPEDERPSNPALIPGAIPHSEATLPDLDSPECLKILYDFCTYAKKTIQTNGPISFFDLNTYFTTQSAVLTAYPQLAEESNYIVNALWRFKEIPAPEIVASPLLLDETCTLLLAAIDEYLLEAIAEQKNTIDIPAERALEEFSQARTPLEDLLAWRAPQRPDIANAMLTPTKTQASEGTSISTPSSRAPENQPLSATQGTPLTGQSPSMAVQQGTAHVMPAAPAKRNLTWKRPRLSLTAQSQLVQDTTEEFTTVTLPALAAFKQLEIEHQLKQQFTQLVLTGLARNYKVSLTEPQKIIVEQICKDSLRQTGTVSASTVGIALSIISKQPGIVLPGYTPLSASSMSYAVFTNNDPVAAAQKANYIQTYNQIAQHLRTEAVTYLSSVPVSSANNQSAKNNTNERTVHIIDRSVQAKLIDQVVKFAPNDKNIRDEKFLNRFSFELRAELGMYGSGLRVSDKNTTAVVDRLLEKYFPSIPPTHRTEIAQGFIKSDPSIRKIMAGETYRRANTLLALAARGNAEARVELTQIAKELQESSASTESKTLYHELEKLTQDAHTLEQPFKEDVKGTLIPAAEKHSLTVVAHIPQAISNPSAATQAVPGIRTTLTTQPADTSKPNVTQPAQEVLPKTVSRIYTKHDIAKMTAFYLTDSDLLKEALRYAIEQDKYEDIVTLRLLLKYQYKISSVLKAKNINLTNVELEIALRNRLLEDMNAINRQGWDNYLRKTLLPTLEKTHGPKHKPTKDLPNLSEEQIRYYMRQGAYKIYGSKGEFAYDLLANPEKMARQAAKYPFTRLKDKTGRFGYDKVKGKFKQSTDKKFDNFYRRHDVNRKNVIRDKEAIRKYGVSYDKLSMPQRFQLDGELMQSGRLFNLPKRTAKLTLSDWWRDRKPYKSYVATKTRLKDGKVGSSYTKSKTFLGKWSGYNTYKRLNAKIDEGYAKFREAAKKRYALFQAKAKGLLNAAKNKLPKPFAKLFAKLGGLLSKSGRLLKKFLGKINVFMRYLTLITLVASVIWQIMKKVAMVWAGLMYLIFAWASKFLWAMIGALVGGVAGAIAGLIVGAFVAGAVVLFLFTLGLPLLVFIALATIAVATILALGFFIGSALGAIIGGALGYFFQNIIMANLQFASIGGLAGYFFGGGFGAFGGAYLGAWLGKMFAKHLWPRTSLSVQVSISNAWNWITGQVGKFFDWVGNIGGGGSGTGIGASSTLGGGATTAAGSTVTTAGALTTAGIVAITSLGLIIGASTIPEDPLSKKPQLLLNAPKSVSNGSPIQYELQARVPKCEPQVTIVNSLPKDMALSEIPDPTISRGGFIKTIDAVASGEKLTWKLTIDTRYCGEEANADEPESRPIGDTGPLPSGFALADNFCQPATGRANCSEELKKTFESAASYAKMPAAMIAAIANQEHKRTFTHTDNEIVDWNREGNTVEPNYPAGCVTSDAGAQGPMQFMPNTWQGHKRAIVDAGKRPKEYDAKACNLLDAAYGSSRKLKYDSGIPFESDDRWTEDAITKASSAYLGACIDKVRAPNHNYCQGVIDFVKTYTARDL